MTTRIENGWMIDENNNCVNIEMAGGEEKATAQLETLRRAACPTWEPTP